MWQESWMKRLSLCVLRMAYDAEGDMIVCGGDE